MNNHIVKNFKLLISILRIMANILTFILFIVGIMYSHIKNKQINMYISRISEIIKGILDIIKGVSENISRISKNIKCIYLE